MAKRQPMTDAELLAAVDAEEQQALGIDNDTISSDRADALDRYYGRDYTGNLATVPGRSSVVSRDVADVVEGVLANVIKPFVGGDKVVSFDPLGPDDEEQAQQETDYINYIVLQRNNGFLMLNAAMKDALLLRAGYVKCSWTKRSDIITETYTGLADEELAIIAQDKDVEIVQHSEYPDPYGEALMPPDPAMMQGQPGMMPPPPPPRMLHDLKLRRARPTEFVEICPTAPDEILVSQRARSPVLQDCDFVQHRTHQTLSELRQMGYDIPDDINDSDDTETLEDMARQRFGDRGDEWDDPTSDPARRLVLFKETWMRIDRDGDGIAELRRICQVGTTLLNDEEADIVPLASYACVLMPHQHLGISVYDMVQDLAQLKTALFRQYMDNKYLANNPQTYVNQNQVNMDDMLISRPGGIRRVDGDPGVAVLERTYPDTGRSALEGLEYLDSVRENRTGYTKQAEGLRGDSLDSKTLGGMMVQLSQAQLRLEMMARTIAETGVRETFKIVHALTLKHSSREEKVKLNNKWVDVNPREWVRRTDLSISVGLGSASQQTMVHNLMLLGQAQEKVMPLGLASPTNIYNATKKLTNAMGFKNDEDFFTAPEIDPQTGKPKPPPPPPPNPMVEVEQVKQQGDAQKFQAEQQADIQKFQAEQQAKQQQIALEAETKRQEQEGALALQASNDRRQQELDAQQHEREMQRMVIEDKFKRDQMDREFAFKQWETLQKSEASALSEQAAGGNDTNQLLQHLISLHSAPRQVTRDASGRVTGIKIGGSTPTVQ